MKPLDRNISVLEHIVTYCEQIEQTVERFGNSAETFAPIRFTATPQHSAFCKSVNWLAS